MTVWRATITGIGAAGNPDRRAPSMRRGEIMAKPTSKWRKSPPELITAFEAAFPGAPAERRQMFGYPAGFVGGNMFTGLFQEDWFVRLGEPKLSTLLKRPGARLFEPMPGRQMKNYVVLPPDTVDDRKTLAG